MHQSIATIDSPEFINLQPMEINPLMSKCEIKVLYIGENRNGSYISKEVATEMSKTLRGAPIVGYYRDSKGDFADHGERVTIDDEGVKFDCMTVPYGFVAPDAKVWFKTFDEQDGFGNTITREYLMTTGFLWTGQFEEAKLAIDEGRPHSMELDKDTLQGNWSTNIKTGMDFFIINDAVFSKLCILGEDVEPCFEGSSVTAPQVSTAFSLDDNFKNTLFSMMKELTFALQGGQNMINVVENPAVEEALEISENFEDNSEKVVVAENEEVTEDTTFTETPAEEVPAEVEFTESTETSEEVVTEEVDSEFAKKDSEEKEEDKKDESKEDSESDSKEEDSKEEEKEDDEDKKKKFSLLEEKYNELETKYNALVVECETLRKFKNEIDDKEKTALIDSFYMLDDADKKEVIENKSQYSLDEIEAKLSVIYTRKNKVAAAEQVEVSADNAVVTYDLANDVSVKSDWVKEVLKTQKEMNL